jgi:hypothetical protein
MEAISMIAKIKIGMRALRDLLCAAGGVALAAFFAAERSWLWLAPMILLVAAVAACFYHVERWRAARHDRVMGDLRQSKGRAVQAIERLSRQKLIHDAVRRPARLHRHLGPPAMEDVSSALRNLGYSRMDARRAVRMAAAESDAGNFEMLFHAAQTKLARPDRPAYTDR